MTSSRVYQYVAYIDEAGDDGLTSVRPNDPTGSSEWLILSAAVIAASREAEVDDWVEDIHNSLWRHQARNLKFSSLKDPKRAVVCAKVAEMNARYFVVCSNKKNMEGYHNPFAAEVPSRNWFYCWMTRLLLERVTDFVSWHSQREYGSEQKIKLVFSNRGGMSYTQFNAYLRWLRFQGDNTVLRHGEIHWGVVDMDQIEVWPHYMRSGLQIADIVASAFFRGCDLYNTGQIQPEFAKALAPRMARYRDVKTRWPSGYGVKLMPSLTRAKLLREQEDVFRFYGYPQQWWAPSQSNREAVRLTS